MENKGRYTFCHFHPGDETVAFIHEKPGERVARIIRYENNQGQCTTWIIQTSYFVAVVVPRIITEHDPLVIWLSYKPEDLRQTFNDKLQLINHEHKGSPWLDNPDLDHHMCVGENLELMDREGMHVRVLLDIHDVLDNFSSQ